MSDPHTALPKNHVSHKEYFRRSRNGRLKCDEAKPSCGTCARRKVQCEGYPKKLRWVQSSDSQKQRSNASKELSIQQDVVVRRSASSKARDQSLWSPSHSCLNPVPLHPPCTQAQSHDAHQQDREPQQRPVTLSPLFSHHNSLSPPPLYLQISPSLLPSATPLDIYLFDYNLFQMSKLVFVNSDPSSSARSDHVALALEPRSLIFETIMASAAIHLSLTGLVDEQLVFTKKSRALKGMRAAIASRQNITMTSNSNNPSNSISPLTRNLLDHMILCASTSLIGMELSQGSPLSQILPLIKGSTTLIVERYRAAHHEFSPPPIFRHCQSLVAYFDILSCVPYPRSPILDTDIWFRGKDDKSLDYDPLMGCFSEIFMLIGRAASLISVFYTGQVDDNEFSGQQNLLTSQLDAWQPFRGHVSMHEDLSKDLEEFVSAQAGNAHKFATMIFLTRSSDGADTVSSHHTQRLISRLRNAMSCVSIDSPFIATMLWPAFVLGCESRESSEQAHTTQWFQDVLIKQRFENIRVALKALQEQIWPNDCFNWVKSGQDASPENLSRELDYIRLIRMFPVGSGSF
ncbi:hypothetical protein DL98DRAFT_612511 [Cadophora sp. DSE1049]|nr:hypothetical protein DL98DRAFT_612511 [Cadophora sp. DSE1049]